MTRRPPRFEGANETTHSMKTIKTSLAGLFVGMTALWLLAEAPALQAAHGFFPWRRLLVQYTGLLAMGAMSAAMLLAVRPAWLESRLHGLDKMYRLHKWLGIGGLVLAIAHWLCAQGPKWLVQAGLLTRPARGQRAPEALEILRQLRSLRGLAEDLGEKAFYIAVVLIVLALVKRFPYRHFFRTHRWLALVYLVLVFHTVVLMEFPYWGQGVGWAMGLLLAAGSVAAAISLLRRIGVRRKAVGEIARVDYMDGVQVHAVALQLKTPWPGHDAGQFAFVTFDEKEGAHPFTTSSAWAGDGRLLFLIKALGDYTRTLGHALRVGDAVTVEGPYGRFQFNGQAQRQVWIGAGIGVTPFVARMQALAVEPDGRAVDFFHVTADVDERALELLRADAQAAGVRLHVIVSGRNAKDERFTGERLRALVPDWLQADVWFCGPAAFGDALSEDLVAHGLAPGSFHRELFEMR